jgi:uncharacterized protein
MEPETQQKPPEATATNDATGRSAPAEESTGELFQNVFNVPARVDQKPDGIGWVFLGSKGLRAGWSISVFLLLAMLLAIPLGIAGSLIATNVLHLAKGAFTPALGILQELAVLLAVLAAGTVVALMERRRLLDFYLTGPQPQLRFIEGLVAGFIGLSILVGELAAGDWLHFGPVALSGAQIVRYAAGWAVCFTLVGLFEEGVFRCYLQYTLTRGINFWWALAIEAALCLDLVVRAKGNGVWGVYAAAMLGLVPCLLLELKKVEGAGFWQAAWVTSTLFGFIHTGNNGENWIGIFAAAAIGFVFCVSIRVTGSAWWAIGCHAGWDWAETYFYGTADSGMQAQGHYLTTSPAGNVLWSGGENGPEGSLLVLGVILLLLLALLAIYGRKRAAVRGTAAVEQLPA